MKLPDFKKGISLFLSSEEAKSLKKNIAKLGLTAAIVAGIMAQNESAQAGGTHVDSSHGDDHTDGTSHSDSHGDSHSDSPMHDDSHADSEHGDDCVGGTTHGSFPVYDPINKRGGHSSQDVHDSCT